MNERRESSPDAQGLSAAVPTAPEDHQLFRLAQLVVLLEVAGELGKAIVTVDRLGFYDFFAANPFAVLDDQKPKDRNEAVRLRLAGFLEGQLSYASTGQRFVSRRRRLQHDLALLIAYGVATATSEGYLLTSLGSEVGSRLSSVYADSYRVGARVVLQRLGSLSDRKLLSAAQQWLGQSPLLIDLMADVRETTPAEGEG